MPGVPADQQVGTLWPRAQRRSRLAGRPGRPATLAPVSALSDRDVLRIAELSRLALTPAERASLTRELAAILTYVEQIGAIDTSGIEPTSHVQLDRPTLRADVPHATLGREDALRNAPDGARGGLFRVPKVIG